MLNLFHYISYELYSKCRLCRREKPQEPDLEPEKPNPEHFLEYCKNGDLEKIEVLLSNSENFCVNTGLKQAVLYNKQYVCDFLLKKEPTNLDECLKISCENNNYVISEMLLKKGANTVVGLRYATSSNIIKMIYRFEQGIEMIT